MIFFKDSDRDIIVAFLVETCASGSLVLVRCLLYQLFKDLRVFHSSCNHQGSIEERLEMLPHKMLLRIEKKRYTVFLLLIK